MSSALSRVSLRELFWSFSKMALQGFGGVLPVAERMLVHQRQWLSAKEFVELLAIAQALPGPNICNLALIVGDRAAGVRGAAAALAGMMCFPLVIVIGLTSVYQALASHVLTQHILLGMAAASVGMIAGMAARLARTQGHFKAGWLVGLLAFVLVALVHAPLGLVILMLAIPSFAIRWWQLWKR